MYLNSLIGFEGDNLIQSGSNGFVGVEGRSKWLLDCHRLNRFIVLQVAPHIYTPFPPFIFRSFCSTLFHCRWIVLDVTLESSQVSDVKRAVCLFSPMKCRTFVLKHWNSNVEVTLACFHCWSRFIGRLWMHRYEKEWILCNRCRLKSINLLFAAILSKYAYI